MAKKLKFKAAQFSASIKEDEWKRGPQMCLEMFEEKIRRELKDHMLDGLTTVCN